MSQFKVIYGSKQDLLALQYTQGAMMLAKDSQQIYFDIGNSRRSFTGIVYLMTQYDRNQLTAPCDKLYFVVQSCKFYYYRSGNWICANESSIVRTTYEQLQQLQQADNNKLYVDTETNSLYYGINISGSILWVKLNASDKISDYIGNVDIKSAVSTNVISTDNSGNIELSDQNKNINIKGNLKYNGNIQNTAGGVAVLNSQGKISYDLIEQPSESSESSSSLQNAYFKTKTFSVQNLTNNIKSFTFQQLEITQPTIVQLLDDTGLVRDDVIPVYWDDNGLNINFNPLVQNSYITSDTGNFSIKYLYAEKYSSLTQSNISTFNTISFDPYGLENNLKSFTFSQLYISSATFVQVIDDTGLIRDDVIPVYWQGTNLYINLAPVASQITQSGHLWKITYLVDCYPNTQTISDLTERVDQLTAIINTLLSQNS